MIRTDLSDKNNIHNYQRVSYNQNGQLTGTRAPDGLNLNPQSPSSTFESATSTAGLTSFNGTNPNGTWTLFVSDMAGGGFEGTLVGWGMEIIAVPEPASLSLLMLGGLLLAACGWRHPHGPARRDWFRPR